jgi:hypothetical protein
MKPHPRKVGNAVAYLIMAAVGATAVAAAISAIGLALWATRWLVDML